MTTKYISPLDILPHVGLGVLRFGQKRSEVRSLLGNPTREFKKVPFADTLTDAYSPLGLHLYYDPADQLESIDVFAPAVIWFDDMSLLGVRGDDVVEAMTQRGYTHDSHNFEEAGLSLYVVHGIVESVTVFVKGCHDTNDPNSQTSRALRAAENWRLARESARNG